MSARADTDADIAVIGAGAAGLMTAIHAARGGARVVALDGSPRLGIKILVAGGGRCNVTHRAVDERDYAGSTPAAIRRVLARFTVAQCVDFFRALGVELKEEDTGKLFPMTDRAATVLDALLAAARDAGVDLRWPRRVESIAPRDGGGFTVGGAWGTIDARLVALCCGGQSLPKSGSDGGGYRLARALGHSIAEPLLPSLVPLVAAAEHWTRSLSGLAVEAEVRVISGTGRKLAAFTGSTLFTHFGLSGPAVLDASRHLLMERVRDPASGVQLGLLPGCTVDHADLWLLEARGQGSLARLRQRLPERLARKLLEVAQIPADQTPHQAPRPRRRELASLLAAAPIPIVGDRGFSHAEATAGGVPLKEVDLATMESRVRPGAYLAGEILDVDGRIGGFNFQWAWASGFVAGEAMARAARSASHFVKPREESSR
jgi:predicted Rossmann fold flavoprotein